MKKVFCILSMIGLMIPSMSYSQTPANGIPVNLTAGIIDPETPMDVNRPKGPVMPPYVTLADHTLYIWSQHSGFTLTLIDGSDTVVYQTYLFAGVQYDVLPTTLSGSFTLILSDDTYMYIGTIGLE